MATITNRKSSMAGYRTRLIIDPADVPKGFVQIARVANNRTEAVWLSRAHSTGVIAAVKLARYASDRTGKVYVDPHQARELLEARRMKPRRNDFTQYEPPWAVARDEGLREQIGQERQPDEMSLMLLTSAVRDLQAAVELLTERLSHANVVSPA
jgi:hypothetical protein